MMIATYAVVALVVVGATDVFGSETGKAHVASPPSPHGDWAAAISNLLKRRRYHLNANNAEALANEYVADGHRLEPGKMAIIGREAIEDSYREDVGRFSVNKMEMTDLRFACDDGAVAEFLFDGGLGWGKGVIVARMEDGVAKIITLIFNKDS